ncbi:MAG: GNAT family N-acetyltransferase [Pseudomonadales bacterium]
MHVRFIQQISDCPAQEWNALSGTDYPFLRHEFLYALEASGGVGKKSGWLPYHALIYQDEQLVGLMPLYRKTHSYGEYVFDWSWADAYQRNGIAYYPKLLSAIPFTPATGPRLCVKNAERQAVAIALQQSIGELLDNGDFSSWHVLFPSETERPAYTALQALQRTGVQYHWFNQAYTSFDDFLATFSSRKRKNLRKERQRVTDQGVSLKVLTGEDLNADVWQQFYHFYQSTYAKRSGHGGYLNQDFFQRLGETMAEQIVLVMAYDNDKPVAAALNLRSSDTLYGRYWGCIRDIDGLHFEACYYQGIEYCIANGLKRFDPGAQGEHKIQRGFTPIPTYSMHWIAHPAFRDAIARFVDEEDEHMARYTEDARSLLPFRADLSPAGD